MFDYQPVVRAQTGDYFGTALVGTYSTVIGWNFYDDALRSRLKGFAVKRTEWDKASGEMLEMRWLGGYKRFASLDTGQLGDVGSLTAPFQRFRWNDYTLNASRAYRYEVYPMRGEPGALIRDETPLVFEFSPTPEDDGELGVYVNRGVTAARAYFNRFGDTNPADVLPPGAAYAWLSRGLRESLVDFINSAQPGDALHLAVYEFFDLEIAHMLKTAADNGVAVIVAHDAKPGKDSTAESRHVAQLSGLSQIAGAVVERNTVNISHNKVAIHLRGGQPLKVWAGSANLSENGFHYQTNNSLLLRNPSVLQAYEDYFQNLIGNPSKSDSRDFNADLMQRANDSPNGFAQKLFYSPIRQEEIIEKAVELIAGAQSMVLISGPFGIHKQMAGAIKARHGALVQYGLANSTAQSKIRDLRYKATRFFPPKRLKTYRGERWDAKAFGAHKIHAKTIIVDPYGANPKVLTGSANFSRASCVDNDENALYIEGNARLAAIYATEFMRMYDHYKSRFYISETEEKNRKIRKQNKQRRLEGKPEKPELTIPIHLRTDDGWSDTAFDSGVNSHKYADRKAFSGL